MDLALQGSLFDTTSGDGSSGTGTSGTDTSGTESSDTAGAPSLRPLTDVHRTELGHGAWIDVLPAWLSGADTLFRALATGVPWHAERRRMYDRTVDVPRLLSFYDEHDTLPDAVLAEAREALSAYYGAELGEPFRTAGLCYYRDGSDSVAWHGDTIGRGRTEDTMVAILSVGVARPLLLRPRGGGATTRYGLGHGDLVVMGGSCQRTWEHAVPKTSKPVGPRISVQFRPRGVR
ncbi:alpha-ketoglutarate-dependent dioxygenase AlkB [Prauserella halophila]|uniref:Alpha-ketoglutarate-dependent dioxygenase AlkB n=1 Tax=Prauserella halophila TaxID=185641 RepID=A0ABN1VX45_9PSEU|nr:alpha-ketoglutarate-dependent dioxygenase AlkB [Prauserella halophila]MCP2237433.1 Alkylated DNA repair dioxygenase AlkB [Prauserella halophila]